MQNTSFINENSANKQVINKSIQTLF